MLAARKHFENSLKESQIIMMFPILALIVCHLLAGIDVTKVSLDPFFEGHSFGDFVVRSILSDAEFTKADPEFGKLSRFEGQFFENLDPFITLRMLTQNIVNLDTDVQWRHADLVEGGCAREADLFEDLGPVDR